VEEVLAGQECLLQTTLLLEVMGVLVKPLPLQAHQELLMLVVEVEARQRVLVQVELVAVGLVVMLIILVPPVHQTLVAVVEAHEEITTLLDKVLLAVLV
jgi:hypothetical protein